MAQTAHLGIAGVVLVRPQVDEASVIRRRPDRNIEARPALRFHFQLKGRTDLVFRLGTSSAETRSAARDRRRWLM